MAAKLYVLVVILCIAGAPAELLPDELTEQLMGFTSTAAKQKYTASSGLDDYEFTGLAAKHKQSYKQSLIIDKPCPKGCEQHGNCNKALGRCECPIGYTGPICDKPLWPSCKVHPAAAEMYCGTWHPKSCDCVRECAKLICPNGPASCERAYDPAGARCFQRPVNHTVNMDGVSWHGGSDIPEEGEDGVKYYLGALKNQGDAKEITRDDFLDLEPSQPDGLMALPLSKCPEQCSYRGGCVQQKQQKKPHCCCHYGFTGDMCGGVDLDKGAQHMCWNNCQGRGECRRGFCHCKPGWWGKDCGRSKAFAAHSARRLVHKLKVYAYDLPWELAYQPEYHLGWRDHDQIYMAWKVFGEMFLNDTVTRTENPWEANMFYIPSMSYAYSSNLGDTLEHNRRVVDYVRQTWPFFNRTKGLDHFLWLTNDRGACDWPGEEGAPLANVIKVVHFGWHHPGLLMPKGWPHALPNKHWGCFHPLRDISATVYFSGQSDTAADTYGLAGKEASFDPKHVPTQRLLFFAGGIRPDDPDYSQGVRQELHRLFGSGSHPNITIHEGGHPQYKDMIRGSKFCLAPSGHGWGIRLSQYMVMGCVPVIIQDDIYQAWEDLLPYPEFSIRFPKSRIPAIAELLAAVSDEEYLALRAGVAKYWRAFVWQRTAVGGMAYEYMMKSLQARMVRLHARHYYPLQPKQQHAPGGLPG